MNAADRVVRTEARSGLPSEVEFRVEGSPVSYAAEMTWRGEWGVCRYETWEGGESRTLLVLSPGPEYAEALAYEYALKEARKIMRRTFLPSYETPAPPVRVRRCSLCPKPAEVEKAGVPFCRHCASAVGEAAARPRVKRESVGPADALDVLLAVWIAQSMLSEEAQP